MLLVGHAAGSEEFGDHKTRDSFLFTENADPKLVEALHPLVNETPAGETLSIGPQPSQLVAPTIDIPVLILIAEDDEIFSAEGATRDKASFLSSHDVRFTFYPGIGHGWSSTATVPRRPRTSSTG